jgi:hypothetical protein
VVKLRRARDIAVVRNQAHGTDDDVDHTLRARQASPSRGSRKHYAIAMRRSAPVERRTLIPAAETFIGRAPNQI